MKFFLQFKDFGRAFAQHQALLKILIKRDISSKFKGSIFGILWTIMNPIMMLIVYKLVFEEIFKARGAVGSNGENQSFALFLFSGLLIFNLFSECLTRAPSLIYGNPNYVKKIVFPLEILPFTILGSAMFNFLIGCLILILGCIFVNGELYLTMLVLPFLLLPFCILLIGLCWLVASLGVFFRDISQIITVVISALMFLSPIFYPSSVLPLPMQKLLFLNPIAFPVEALRDIVILGALPGMYESMVYFFGSLLIGILGYLWFQLTRKAFSDAI